MKTTNIFLKERDKEISFERRNVMNKILLGDQKHEDMRFKERFVRKKENKNAL